MLQFFGGTGWPLHGASLPTLSVIVPIAVALLSIALLNLCRFPVKETTPRAELIAKIIADVAASRNFVLDNSRRKFVEDAAASLADLVQGRLVDRDRYKRLLLGRKGVGKTTLLQRLLAVATTMLQRHGIICVYLDYSDAASAPTPLEAVVAGLPAAFQLFLRLRLSFAAPHRHIAIVESFLRSRGITVFAVVDELQNVYRPCERGMAIIGQLSALGASKAGVLHWVLSGSSAYLRQLVTARVEYPSKEWPNYTKLDLNGTKFVPVTIEPFVEPQDFRSLVHRLVPEGVEPPVEAALGELYLRTGGVPSFVAERLARGPVAVDTFVLSSKGIGRRDATDTESVFLRALLEVVNAFVPVGREGSESDLDVYARWTSMVSFDGVAARAIELGAPRTAVLSTCYNLADRGLVRFHASGSTVGFGSAMMMQQLWTDDTALTHEEVVALRKGNQATVAGGDDLAGSVTLRMIAVKAVQSDAFGFRIPSSLPLPTALSPVPPLAVGYTRHSAERVVNRMWKELLTRSASSQLRDSLGADGVVILPAEPGGHPAWRIQVKISSAEVTAARAEEWVKGLLSQRLKAQDVYSAAGLPLKTQTLVLATTADLLPQARAWLEGRGIVIWDRAFLAEHVWPDNVKLIGERFRR